jgi:serine/threonine protein kinase
MSAKCSIHPRFIDSGHVQLISAIGNGAYGVVYNALYCRYDTPLNRPVKQLPCHWTDDHQRSLQMQETSLHRRASGHPSITNIDRLVEENDRYYLVMDYAEEGNLFTMITEKRHVGLSHASRLT